LDEGRFADMAELFRQGWIHQQDSRERAWTAEYELYEVKLAFLRARIGALVRSITWPARARAPQLVPVVTEGSQVQSISIDSIVGLVDAKGRRTHGIPVLRRSMAEAWRRTFREADHDSHLPLSVVAGGDGWYLAGGSSALVTLEVLRARRIRSIPVRTLSVRELRRCKETDRDDDCFGAA
jgi:hypothetical protein